MRQIFASWQSLQTPGDPLRALACAVVCGSIRALQSYDGGLFMTSDSIVVAEGVNRPENDLRKLACIVSE